MTSPLQSWEQERRRCHPIHNVLVQILVAKGDNMTPEKRVPPEGGIDGYRERIRSFNRDDMIAQAIGELRGFAVVLSRGNSGLTAAQLDLVLDMALVYASENGYLE